jgi:uncharacterized protein YabN with tetrapyrrole methylase and pyrophosphatase domain
VKKGSLIVVGTGISVGQLTAEARSVIAMSEKVLYCVADALTERLILQLNPDAESLYPKYGEGKQRRETYREMIERTMECVRSGRSVCVAYYGHPGVFVNPSHRAIRIAREEGYAAKMLPAVSSIDCLVCDLGVDMAAGCQIFEATDLMLRQRQIDCHGHVIILQVAALGDLGYSFNGYDCRNLTSLREYLLKFYPGSYEIVAYEASHYGVLDPVSRRMRVCDLGVSEARGISTLYIPQLSVAPVHLRYIKQYNLEYLMDDIRLVPINEPQEVFDSRN